MTSKPGIGGGRPGSRKEEQEARDERRERPEMGFLFPARS